MFLPLGDDNRGVHTTPYVVFSLVGINAFVWYLQLTLGDSFTYGYSAVPYELTRYSDLSTPQPVSINGTTVMIPHAPGPSFLPFTLVSAMFMHGSWMHIIGNMLYLFIFGDQIEDLLGHVKFLLFYLVCGIGASVAHIMIDPGSPIPSLGASGAIAGVLGAYLLRYPHNRVRVIVMRTMTYFPAYIVLGGWIVLQIFGQVGSAVGQATGVAYMAHIGGFVVGAAAIAMLAPRRDGRARR